jgi:hypothetical protein
VTWHAECFVQGVHRTIVVTALCLSSTIAHAQPASPPAVPPATANAGAAPPVPPPAAPTVPLAPGSSAQAVTAPPTVSPEAIQAWRARYVAARAALARGDFKTASEQMAELWRTAPDAESRAVALELGMLAVDRQRRGFSLIHQSDLADTNVDAKARNRRTTDELAILYTQSVFYGLGTGAWIAVLSKPDSAAGGILPALALAGGSAGLVAILDRGDGLGYGVAQSIVTGMNIGLEEGLALTLWNQARVRRSDEWSGSTMGTVIWGLSTAGALTGGIVGSVAGTTPGRASFVGSTALWSGVVSGLTLGALVTNDATADEKALLGAGIGINAGAALGAAFASDVSPSIARVRYLDLGGLAGGLLFGGLYLAAADKNGSTQGGARHHGAGRHRRAHDGLAGDGGDAAGPIHEARAGASAARGELDSDDRAVCGWGGAGGGGHVVRADIAFEEMFTLSRCSSGRRHSARTAR